MTSLLFKASSALKSHTSVRVFAGRDSLHRAACGSLFMMREEWEALKKLLELATLALDKRDAPRYDIEIREEK